MKGFLAVLMIIFSSPLILWAQKNASSTLYADEAVEQLKRDGRYDSLMETFERSRRADGKDDGDTANDAVGQTTKLIASDGGSGDNFGFSVALDGETAVIGAKDQDVGANASQGAVYIFIRNGTVWIEQQKLMATDGAEYDRFGYSVAINGTTIAVGAPFKDTGANIDQGAVYVFTRSGMSWTEQQKLTASDGATDDLFGIDIGIDGNTIISGSAYDDVGGNNTQGSAYVFVRNGMVWTEQQKLTASDGIADDHFGDSVGISGNTVVIGSFFDDVGPNTNQGSAYVFSRSGTIWTEQQKLVASDGAAVDRFGDSVAVSGNTIIVASVFDDIGTAVNQGSAYIFVKNGTTWTQQTKLVASDGMAGDNFGYSVSISGDMAVVGAIGNDIGANDVQGSAYVFARNGTSWTQQGRLIGSDSATGDRLGYSTAVSGNSVIVGAPFDFIGSSPNDEGSAYVFRVLGSFWSQEALKVADDGRSGGAFGVSVSISGDTAIIGAPNHHVGANNEQGAAYIFVRNGNNWLQQSKIIATDGAAFDFFGNNVFVYGDTAIIGAPNDDIGTRINQGSAYIFVRNGTVWSQYRKVTAADGAMQDLFGSSVSINGETLIIGAPNVMGGNGNQGAAYVFVKFETEWIQQAKLIDEFGGSSDNFGNSVAVNENTAVVGAYHDDLQANIDQGAAYVFIRNGTNWSRQAYLYADDGAINDFFGSSVAINDRTILIGSPYSDIGTNANQGAVYVFVRNGNGWAYQQKLSSSDGSTNDFFGNSVSIDGDAALIGAFQDDIAPNVDQGSAYVFERAGTVWTQKQKLTGTNAGSMDIFGFSVGISGNKVVIGAPFSEASAPFNGEKIDKESHIFGVSGQGATYFFINVPSVPTAANVSIGGRVFTSSGTALQNAIIYLMNSNGEIRTTRSSVFGYYQFDEVQVGQVILVRVKSKNLRFEPQIVNVSDELCTLHFFASP